MDGGLTEVIRVGLHGEAVYAHGHWLLIGSIKLVVAAVTVITGLLQYAVCNEVLAGHVGFHDGVNKVFRHILVVGEQLLGVLRQAVAAVAKARVVVMGADARVEAHAVDDLAGIQALGLGVGVELVEVGDAQCQIRVGEQLDGFGLGEAHEQRVNVLLDGTLLQQLGEGVGGLHEVLVLRVGADHNAARVQVVVQSLGFAQELRAEDDVLGTGLLTDGLGVADRDGGLDDHDRVRVDLHHQLDDGFHCGGVEEVFRAVVVGRRGDNHEIGIRVGLLAIERGSEVQLLLREVLLDVVILNRGLTGIDHVDLCRNNIHRGNLMMLSQKRS